MPRSVKKAIEHFLYFSNSPITIVGGINIDGPGSGVLDLTISGVGTIPVGGQVLLAVAELAIKSAIDIDIDVIGTDEASANVTGNVIIPKFASRTRAIRVDTPSATDLFLTVTSVTINSGGVAGDTLVLLGIPEYTRILNPATSIWNYIPFTDGFDIDIGAGQEVVFDKYDPDHFKRTRLDNTLSITSRYVDVATGLMLIDGAEISLRQEVKPDGGSLVSEQHFVAGVRLSTAPSVGEGEAIATVTADGGFTKIARELLVPNL